MKYQMFKREALCNQCRECVNQVYGLDLQRKDCWYLPYMEHCNTCGEMRNIVADINWNKRWKIWLYQKKEIETKGRT